MADLVEGMICHLAMKMFGTLVIENKNAAGEVSKRIDLQRPWRRVTMVELVEERSGWKFDGRSMLESDTAGGAITMLQEAVLMHAAINASRSVDGRVNYLKSVMAESDAGNREFIFQKVRQNLSNMSPAEQLVDVYEKLIEPTLISPTFVTQVPSVVIPLARKHRQDPFFADVYELAINGQEISPGYSELNEPDVQAANFTQQVGDEAEKHKVDEDFLTALRYGMPPAGGMGLGIDRLIMMLTGAESIRDVILFPLMKPHDHKMTQ
jgi:lysyl-tRNA synthetase class 2